MLSTAFLGDADRARAFCRQTVDMTDASGGSLARPWSLGFCGFVEWLLDDRLRAARLVRESLATMPSTAPFPWGLALPLEVLAWDAAVREDPERAARK